MDDEVILKVKEFVRKFNSREFIIDSRVFGFNLANAISEFEISKQDDRYDDVVEKLNNLIDRVYASGGVYDNNEKQQLMLYENKCKELEQVLLEKDMTITKLNTEIITLKERIRIHECMDPSLKKLGKEESEVEEIE